MPTLYVLIGSKASGKTHYSTRYKDSLNAIRLSEDDFYAAFGHRGGAVSFLNLICFMMKSTKANLVLDMIAHTKQKRLPYLKAAREAGYSTVALICNTTRNAAKYYSNVRQTETASIDYFYDHIGEANFLPDSIEFDEIHHVNPETGLIN